MNPKNQIATFIFLERLWFVGAILGMLCVIYFLVTKDNDSALFFFGFFILSSVIYLMRKRQRKKHQAYLAHNSKEGKKSN